MITLCSIFRNSAHYVDRYLDQIAGLRKLVDVNLVLTYGDCTDNTYGTLLTSGVEMDLSECSHGGPNHGSIDHPERWDNIAKVVRHTLDRVTDKGDALVWVEADLIWHPATIIQLLDDLMFAPAAAPQLLADGSDRWYDTWGYRWHGQHFAPHPPHIEGGFVEGALVKIDSCGSVFATRGEEWRDWSGHWPYTAAGGLWLDPTVTVRHP